MTLRKKTYLFPMRHAEALMLFLEKACKLIEVDYTLWRRRTNDFGNIIDALV